MTDPYRMTIRRLPNGAIDTDYYLARSSRIRSREAYRLGAAIRRISAEALVVLGRSAATAMRQMHGSSGRFVFGLAAAGSVVKPTRPSRAEARPMPAAEWPG